MNHADPWDEIARLNKQMDVELQKQLRSEQQDGAKRRQKSGQAAKDEAKN